MREESTCSESLLQATALTSRTPSAIFSKWRSLCPDLICLNRLAGNILASRQAG